MAIDIQRQLKGLDPSNPSENALIYLIMSLSHSYIIFSHVVIFSAPANFGELEFPPMWSMFMVVAIFIVLIFHTCFVVFGDTFRRFTTVFTTLRRPSLIPAP